MAFILKGTNFGKVFNVAGARNFFGDGSIGGGWRQHKPLKLVPGYSWNGAMFISKTTTLYERPGKMPLRADLQSKEYLPDCVYVDWLKSLVLNDIALSGPGAMILLNLGIWQSMTAPFLISFMSVAPDKQSRLRETEVFCIFLDRVRRISPRFQTKFGLEINDSCPNAGHDPQLLAIEAPKKLAVVRNILPDVPVVWKINALTSPWQAKEIIDTGFCDAVAVSNTIPWLQNATWTKKSGTQIDWQGLFGTDISPLKRRGYGNGGLSGWPIFNLVVDWVATARDIGITIPIKAEGGIQTKADISQLANVGANAVGLGCVSFLKPWRLKGLIEHGNAIL